MSVNAEAVEVPNIIAQQSLPASESPVPPEVPSLSEPSVSDVSSAVPPAETSEVIPSTSKEIAPAGVDLILGIQEKSQVLISQQEEAVDIQSSNMPQMENMGYDQVSPSAISSSCA